MDHMHFNAEDWSFVHSFDFQISKLEVHIPSILTFFLQEIKTYYKKGHSINFKQYLIDTKLVLIYDLKYYVEYLT